MPAGAAEGDLMRFSLWTSSHEPWLRFIRIGFLAAAGLMPALNVGHSKDMPPDVSAFIEERQICDHFRGEGSDDPERQAEIDASLDRYCTGTDARLAGLRAKYRDDVAILADLDEFEDRIE